MNIVLEYVAMLKVNGPRSGSWLALDEGATVGDVMTRLGLGPEHQRVVAPFVNEAPAKRHQPLREGDRLFLAMPVGGG